LAASSALVVSVADKVSAATPGGPEGTLVVLPYSVPQVGVRRKISAAKSVRLSDCRSLIGALRTGIAFCAQVIEPHLYTVPPGPQRG
jgi:hypothetical protein